MTTVLVSVAYRRNAHASAPQSTDVAAWEAALQAHTDFGGLPLATEIEPVADGSITIHNQNCNADSGSSCRLASEVDSILHGGRLLPPRHANNKLPDLIHVGRASNSQTIGYWLDEIENAIGISATHMALSRAIELERYVGSYSGADAPDISWAVSSLSGCGSQTYEGFDISGHGICFDFERHPSTLFTRLLDTYTATSVPERMSREDAIQLAMQQVAPKGIAASTARREWWLVNGVLTPMLSVLFVEGDTDIAKVFIDLFNGTVASVQELVSYANAQTYAWVPSPKPRGTIAPLNGSWQRCVDFAKDMENTQPNVYTVFPQVGNVRANDRVPLEINTRTAPQRLIAFGEVGYDNSAFYDCERCPSAECGYRLCPGPPVASVTESNVTNITPLVFEDVQGRVNVSPTNPQSAMVNAATVIAMVAEFHDRYSVAARRNVWPILVDTGPESLLSGVGANASSRTIRGKTHLTINFANGCQSGRISQESRYHANPIFSLFPPFVGLDASLDASVIAHEYGHVLHRQVLQDPGAAKINRLLSEGLADWHALAWLRESGHLSAQRLLCGGRVCIGELITRATHESEKWGGLRRYFDLSKRYPHYVLPSACPGQPLAQAETCAGTSSCPTECGGYYPRGQILAGALFDAAPPPEAGREVLDKYNDNVLSFVQQAGPTSVEINNGRGSLAGYEEQESLFLNQALSLWTEDEGPFGLVSNFIGAVAARGFTFGTRVARIFSVSRTHRANSNLELIVTSGRGFSFQQQGFIVVDGEAAEYNRFGRVELSCTSDFSDVASVDVEFPSAVSRIDVDSAVIESLACGDTVPTLGLPSSPARLYFRLATWDIADGGSLQHQRRSDIFHPGQVSFGESFESAWGLPVVADSVELIDTGFGCQATPHNLGLVGVGNTMIALAFMLFCVVRSTDRFRPAISSIIVVGLVFSTCADNNVSNVTDSGSDVFQPSDRSETSNSDVPDAADADDMTSDTAVVDDDDDATTTSDDDDDDTTSTSGDDDDATLTFDDDDDDATETDACAPACVERQCGDDGCGGSCGDCRAGLACTDSLCVPAKKCDVDCPNTEMVEIPAGDFLVGCAPGLSESECAKAGGAFIPSQLRYTEAFLIDAAEVTLGNYAACVDDGICDALYCDDGSMPRETPVPCATFFDARTFCLWLDKRLPTADEWEHAARGSDGRWFPWGNEPELSCEVAVVPDCGFRIPAISRSKSFDVSVFGSYDMMGNVAEWLDTPSPFTPARWDSPRPLKGFFYTLPDGWSPEMSPSDYRLWTTIWLNPFTMLARMQGFRCARSVPD